MEPKFIIGQILSIIGVLFTILSYQMKTPKKLLIVQTCATAFFCLHYVLIGGITGVVMNAVGVVRNFTYYHKDKKFYNNKFSRVFFPLLFACVMVTLGIITWEGWYSVFMTAGIAINTVCLSFSSSQNIRKSILVTSPMVMIYNICVFSIGGIINEALAVGSAIVGIIRYRKKNDDKKVEA